jgi:ankyrin repeat protein
MCLQKVEGVKRQELSHFPARTKWRAVKENPHTHAVRNRLGQEKDRVAMAAQLCTCVFDGNMPLLRRLITAGAPADAGDYDKRTALHIAAAEGNTAAVSTLPCKTVPRPPAGLHVLS